MSGDTFRPLSPESPEPPDAQIYAAVYDAILEQRLAPGTKLPEDSLGEIFGVSRTIVRKALIRLAHQSLLEIRPNRGAVVASPDGDEAAEVFDARRVIEGAIIEKVCAAPPAHLVSRLKDLVVRERQAHETGDRASWIRLSGEFHLLLADLAGNDVLTGYMRELVSRTSLIISLYQQAPSSACSFDEHTEIIDALAAGDAARATQLMDDHIAACEAQLVIEPQQPKNDLAQIFKPAASARREAAE